MDSATQTAIAISGTEVTVNQEIDAADLGNLVFTPAANFSGTTSFAWNGSDGSSYAAADAEVILAIAVNNDLPELNNVSLSQDEDTDIALTAADFTNAFNDSDGDSLVKIKITSLPDNGTLALSGTAVTANQEIDAADLGNLVFTPAANFNGSTSFGWNGFDGIAYAADDATVSLTVNPINDAPVLGTVTISGDEDSAISFSSENFSSHFSDSDGESLAKVKISSLPADGTLTLDGTAVSENQEIEPSELGNLVFTPAANFNGSASFAWNGSDGIAYAAAEGTVSITVNPLADLPTVSNFSLSGDEDSNIALSSQDFGANFSDPDGESLAKIQITSLPENGSLQLDGTAVAANSEIDAADLDNLVFAPAANWNGSTSFGWNGSDGTGYAETEATASLTVNAVNDAPIAGAIASQTTIENRSFEFQFAENIFRDIEGDSLSYSATTPAWLSFDPSSRTFSGTPSSSDIGTQVVEVAASDGQDTTSITFELKVNPNNPPVVANSAQHQGFGFRRGQFSFAANSYVDPDPGDSVTYSIALANALSYSWYDWARGTNGGWYRKAKEGIAFPEVDMPSWLSFDPETRTINIDEANRPNRFRYGVKITGTDSSGASTSEFVWLQTSVLGGFVIDNYIAGATVFWDANKNGIQDAGEPSTTSDQTGEFDLDVAIEDYDANNNGALDPAEGQIVAFGGIDTATGLPLETPVTAAPEATVVTLLTTLVADLADKGLTVNEANERVVAALSLPSGVDINSLDPIAATENNEVGGT